MTNDMQTRSRSEIAQGSFDSFAPLASQSLFWRAHYLAPSPMLEALPLLFWLSENIRPRIGVTIGLEDPVAWFAMCQSIQKLGLDTMCFGVDRNASDLSAVIGRSERHYAEFAQVLQMDHGRATDLLEDAEVDLLIINRSASMDLQDNLDMHWLPKMSDRGAVLFLAGGENLSSYVDRISEGAGYFMLNHEVGICLALRGPRHDDRIERLCQLRLGQPGYLAVRNVFTRMGELHRRTAEMDSSAHEDRAATDAGRVEAKTQIADLKERADTAARDLEAQDRKAAAHLDEIDRARQTERAEAAQKIAALQGDIAAAQAEADKNRRDLDERSKHAAALTRARDAAQTRASEQTAALEQATARLDQAEQSRQTQRADAEKRIDALQSALDEAEAIRQDLTDRAEADERQNNERFNDIAILGLELQAKEEELQEARAHDKGQIETLRQILHETQTQRDEARQRVDDLERSSSWRITSPLRRASLMVRRGEGRSDK